MRRGLFAALLVLVLGLAAPAVAAAQTWTWTGAGTDGKWSTGTNWDQLSAPSANADLAFPSPCLVCTVTNDINGLSVNSLTVDAGTGYAINGTGITLTNGLSTTTSGGAGSPTLGLPIDVAGAQTWNLRGGTLSLAGQIANDQTSPGDVALAFANGAGLSLAAADSLDSLTTSGTGTVALGSTTSPASLGLSRASTLATGTTLALPIDGPGTDFSHVSATGTIDVTGADLQLTGGANCSGLVAGQVDTIVAGANVLGPFANVPDGTTLPLCTGIRARVNYGASGVTATIIGTPATAISIAPPNPVTNQPVTATATVSGAGPAPSGTVTISDGSVQCANVPLVNGAAPCALGSFAAGAQTVQANYTPDALADYLPSSASQPESIAPDPAAMALAGPTSVGKGQAATYSVQIAPTYTGSIPLWGTVKFEEDGQPVNGCASVAVQPPAQGATCSSVAFSTLGSHSVSAIYSDPNFTAPTASQPVTVDAAGSTTTISTVPGNPEANEPTTVIAKVMATGAAGQPVGRVEFEDGAADLPNCQSVPVDGSGQATCDATFGTAAPHDLTATFKPDPSSTVAQSATNFVLNVQRAPTTVTLASSSQSPTVNQPVTYTATVAPAYGGAPTGRVSFSDNGATISGCGGQPVGTSQAATCTVGYPSATTHTVTATYSGDANFDGSGTGPLTLTVSPPPMPGVVVTTLGPMSVTTTAAKLKGTIDTHGAAVSWQFQYGSKLPYSKATPAKSIGAGQGTVRVSAPVKLLSPASRYHVQLVVLTIGDGQSQVAFGRDLVFTTKPLGKLTLALSSLRTATNAVSLPLRCAKAAACRGQLTLTAKAAPAAHGHPARTLGCARASYRIAAGQAQTVVATLTPACQSLARAHHKRLRLTAMVIPQTPQLGFARTVTLVLLG